MSHFLNDFFPRACSPPYFMLHLYSEAPRRPRADHFRSISYYYSRYFFSFIFYFLYKVSAERNGFFLSSSFSVASPHSRSKVNAQTAELFVYPDSELRTKKFSKRSNYRKTGSIDAAPNPIGIDHTLEHMSVGQVKHVRTFFSSRQTSPASLQRLTTSRALPPRTMSRKDEEAIKSISDINSLARSTHAPTVETSGLDISLQSFTILHLIFSVLKCPIHFSLMADCLDSTNGHSEPVGF